MGIVMKKFSIRYIRFLCILLLLSACSTNSISEQKSSTKDLSSFINNKASMTVALKSLHHDFNVKLLKTGVDGYDYVRISSLNLESEPVIVAFVSTKLINSTFVNILKNAGITPIGKMLFAPKADIHRNDNMKVKVILVSDIKNNTIHSYINRIGYKDSTKIVVRYSEFYHKYEVMKIDEYILPSITKYFSK
jgi:chorismate-pyruvate lyase